MSLISFFFFFSSRRRHTRLQGDWSSDVCSSDLLAAWCFAGIALVLTFPFWITVNVLGDSDNGVILAGYLASWLMAGAVLAIGAAVSAVTKNQVIAFVVTAALVFVLAVAGTPVVLGLLRAWAPSGVIRAVAGASLFGHFTAIPRGVVNLRD